MLPIAIMAVLICAGYALSLAGLRRIAGTFLSKAVFYGFLPIVMFHAFAGSKVSSDLLAVAAISATYAALASAAAVAYSRARRLERRRAASLLLAAVFQNSAFLPFPLALALYGTLTVCAAYSLTIVTIHYITVGLLAAAYRGGGSFARRALAELARIPVIPAGILGLALSASGASTLIPGAIHEMLGVVSKVGVYLSAVAVGAGLPRPKEFRRGGLSLDEAYVVLGRHLASPAVHLSMALPLSLDDLAFKQVMLESVMPPATSNTVVAFVYGFDVDLVAKSTIISTVVGLLQALALALLLG